MATIFKSAEYWFNNNGVLINVRNKKTVSNSGGGGGGGSVNWAPINIGAGGWITGLDLQGTEKLARTDTGGLYRWNATISRWDQLLLATTLPSGDCGPGQQRGVYESRIAPSDTTVFYMTYDAAVYRSTNRGTTWTKTALTGKSFDPNAGSRMYGPKMAVDPANKDVVYAGIANDGVYVTTDGGTSWSAKIATFPVTADQDKPYIIVIDTSNGTQGSGATLRTKNVWVHVQGSGTYRSTDGGSSWSLTSSCPVTVCRMIAGQDGYVYASSNDTNKYFYVWNGSTWSVTITDGNLAGNSVAVNPNNRAHVIHFRSGGVPIHSTDHGTTWGSINWLPQLHSTTIPWIGWAFQDRPNADIADGEILFDPNVSGRIWAGYGLGVCYADVTSSDTSILYHDESQGIEQMVVNVIQRIPGGNLVIGMWDRATMVFDPTSGTYPDRYYPDYNFDATWDVSITNSGTIYALNTNLLDTTQLKAAKSTNGGTTWSYLGSVPGKYGNLQVDPTDANRLVWIPVIDGESSYNSIPSYSSDGGATWNHSSSYPTIDGWNSFFYPPASFVRRRSLAVDASGNFYAMYWSGAGNLGGVFRSTDHGVNWTRQCVEPGNQADPLWPVLHWGSYNATLKAAPGLTGDLWMCAGFVGSVTPNQEDTNDGLVHSTDGGVNWSGISNVSEPQTFGFGKAKPGGNGFPTIYMTGYVNHVYGLWRSTDTGATWTNIGIYPMDNMDAISWIGGDMDHYGWVYVGFYGCGAAWRDTSAIT
jgi:hypothetical protein